MQNQKGFIQISLLVIVVVLVVVASLGAGVVLYRQGKLASITANISGLEAEKEKLEIEKAEAEAEGLRDRQEAQRIAEEQKEEELPTEEQPPKEGRLPEISPCEGMECSSCQYCVGGKCVLRPDGYNDCGSGCQRCVNGSCWDYDAACSTCQHCSSDNCINYCQGTHTSCGCTSCTDCNNLDGWVNSDSSYSCCNEEGKCVCQKQEYRDYSCLGTSCVPSVTNTKINKTGCTKCGSSQTCLGGICQDIYSVSFYSALQIGDFVHQLNFSLSNNSSQMITATKVEFFDKNGEITETISAAEIVEIWQGGNVKAAESLSGSIGFQIPPSIKEVEEWQVKWYCLDSNKSPFIISGTYSSLELPF